MITTIIVDDHFVVRNGLAASLEIEPDIRVVEVAEKGAAAVEVYTRHLPAVVILDLQLPDMNGVEVTAALRAADPAARILLFSTFARMDEIQAALDAGATGYLGKASTRDELIHAVRMTAAGRRHLPDEIALELNELLLGPAITSREREIIALVAKGSANKEIGSLLGITEDTVKQHVSRILSKLNVKDRAQAATEAIRRGIIRV